MKILIRLLILPLVATYASVAGLCVAIVWALDPKYDGDAAVSAFGEMMDFTKTLLH